MIRITKKEPLVIFDLETTGTDVNHDRIVQFAAIKLGPKMKLIDKMNMLINPLKPISSEASDVHGITNKDVRGCPSFDDVVDQVAAYMADCVWCGYNVNTFDVPLLLNEMKRCGYAIDELPTIIDVYQIFKQEFPHTLEGAYRFYCGEEIVDAHDALGDAATTAKVLRNAIKTHFAYKPTPSEIEDEYRDPDQVDLAGKLRWNHDHTDILFTFGKYKGQSVQDNLTYVHWAERNGVLGDDALRAIRSLI